MLGYVTIGTNDFEAAKTFYDRVLAGLGGKRGVGGEGGAGVLRRLLP